MPNHRIFYACQAAAVAADGTNTFTAIHGLQSIGINTKFNLEQVFEIGQLSIYDNVENIPDIEVTAEKVLDGYPLIYHLCTYPSPTPSLTGRSVAKCTLGLSIYSDQNNSASGTPFAQAYMSGMYVSSLTYTLPVQGNCTESVTLVGNNKWWNQSFTSPTFNNLDSPFTGGDVLRRQNVVFGSAGCILPLEIPGISASGTNELTSQGYNAHIQNIKTSVNLGRNPLYELGTRAVFLRYVQFPVKVTTDFEVLDITGDNVQALENATNNVFNQVIVLTTTDGMIIDLGVKNKLASVTFGGGNAGVNGGNATSTFSYETWSDFTVTQPQDPSDLTDVIPARP